MKITQEELREILVKHELWLAGNPAGVQANLTGMDLSLMDLSWASLEWAILIGTNLVGANLRGIQLQKANLTGANLEGVNLTTAILTAANLQSVRLIRANLEGARLMQANLKWANLRSANLEWTNLRDANLEDADFTRANLKRTILAGANLKGATPPRESIEIIQEQLERLGECKADNEILRQFAYTVLYGGKVYSEKRGQTRVWGGGITDAVVWEGCNLQDLAEDLGIIRGHKVVEPCGSEHCFCLWSCDDGDVGTCYRPTGVLV